MQLYFLQKLQKSSGRIMLLAFSIFVFIVLPFVRTDSAIDPDLTFKYFITAIFFILLSIYLFFSNDSIFAGRPFKKITIVILALFFWMALSILQSINKGDAVSEWLRLAILYCTFLIAYFIFKKSSGHLKIISQLAAVAVLIFSTFGFFELYSIVTDFYLGKTDKLNILVSAGLANKNFFSEVLVLFIPFLISGIYINRKFWKTIIIVSLLADIFFIIIIQTLAAWVAILISGLFFLILAGVYGIKLFDISISRKYVLVIVLSIVIALTAGFVVFKRTSNFEIIISKIKNASEYFRDPSLLSTTRAENNNSIFERLVIWRNSLKMIADHPLSGAGLNNWKLYNPSYGIGGTDYTNSGFVNYEHPHNDYLLIWAEQGPIGILLYLLFLFLILQTGIKKIRNSDNQSRRLLLFFICGVISFMVLSLFAYPYSRFYPTLLLMIIYAVIVSEQDPNLSKMPLKSFAVTIFLVSVFGSVAAYNRLTGEIHSKNLIIAQLKKNYARMIREADKAYSWYFPLDITGTPISWYKGMAWFYSGERTLAISEYEKAIKINPNHLRLLNDLATSYEQNGEREKAIYYYRKALNITPLFVDANINLSAAYYNNHKIDSSFYFIDRVYYSTGIDQVKNYRTFLNAILHTKSYEIINSNLDSLAIVKIQPVISNPDSLRKIYDNSKRENQTFSQYLLNYCRRIEKGD